MPAVGFSARKFTISGLRVFSRDLGKLNVSAVQKLVVKNACTPDMLNSAGRPADWLGGGILAARLFVLLVANR